MACGRRRHGAMRCGAGRAGALPAAVTGISIDSRTIRPGKAFFAIGRQP